MTGIALDLAEIRPGMRILVSESSGADIGEEIPEYRLVV
jgi:hypothetical protein